MQTAWITGAGGLIGGALVGSASRFAPDKRVVALTRAELDLLDYEAVRERFQQDRPGLVIHCAALSYPPSCQKDPALSQRINVEATSVLAELAREIPLIFLSSDLVFDGRAGNYDESSPVSPLTVYARTKVAAEKLVLDHPKHIVIRTSLNGGASASGDRGFNEQLRRAFQAGQKLTLFTDEFRRPIAAVETARAIWELAAHNQPGIFHVAGSERLSRFQIGRLIAARWPQLNPQIEPESLAQYNGAPRSADPSLNCAKAQRLLSFPLPGLTEWLARHPGELF